MTELVEPDLKTAGREWASKHSMDLATLEAVDEYHYHDPDGPRPDFPALLDQMWAVLCDDPAAADLCWVCEEPEWGEGVHEVYLEVLEAMSERATQ
jgi:hypothetical protein